MISVPRLPKQEAAKVADIMLLYKLAMPIRSFLGSISTLIRGSGLEEYLQTAYKGVQNMLNGNWSHAVRRFCMVSSGLVHRTISASR